MRRFAFGFLGLVMVIGGPFSAVAHASNPPVTASGPNHCDVSGKLKFSPPLVNGGTAAETVTVKASLANCTTNTFGIASGKLKGTFTLPNNDCATPLNDLATGTSAESLTKWKGSSRYVGTSTLGGTEYLYLNNGEYSFQLYVGPFVSIPGGEILPGSFAGQATSILAALGDDHDVYVALCAGKGVKKTTFSGAESPGHYGGLNTLPPG